MVTHDERVCPACRGTGAHCGCAHCDGSGRVVTCLECETDIAAPEAETEGAFCARCRATLDHPAAAE